MQEQIIFARVKGSVKEPGVIYFPNKTALKTASMLNPSLIDLDNLADPNCKKCYGKGIVEVVKFVTDVPTKTIAKVIDKYVDDEPEQLPERLLILLRLPSRFVDIITKLVEGIKKELKENDRVWVINEFAKIFKEETASELPVYCKCYLKKLRKEIDDRMRKQKFSIN